MPTFKCNRSGNTMDVDNLDDVFSMRKHEGYTEVVKQVDVIEQVEASEHVKIEEPVVTSLPKHKGGRPRKNS